MRFFNSANLLLFFVFALLAFPLFYFVYKYSVPHFGTIDFFEYYKLYQNMDFKSADSPLNMRLFGSFFVYLLNKTGLVYNTETNVDHLDFEKSIYFNSILVNFIFVVMTCVIIYNLLNRAGNNRLMSFLGATSYLLGFGTIFYELMPLADAPAIFLFSLVLWYYYGNSHLILIPLVLLIIQREYIFLALGLIALLDYFKVKNGYYLYVLGYCIVFFVVYVILRKMFFETVRYSHHTNLSFILQSLKDIRFPLLPFFRQTAMTMNISFIYIGIILYKSYKKMPWDRFQLLKLSLLLVQIFILSFLLALGNNTGRYFYILVPLVIIALVSELRAFRLELSNT